MAESKRGKLVVISGPSGVGKSTIVREALRRTGAVFSVSVTTRAPRPGERDGREYRFVDRPTFQRMIEQGELLEWAEVFGCLYGTPAQAVREAISAGRTMVLEIDIQGGLQVHRVMPDATFVLIVPPGEEELRRRLQGRGTEDAASLERRFGLAAKELRQARESGAYTREVVNDDLQSAIENVVEILQE
jgi:guanylate kinase